MAWILPTESQRLNQFTLYREVWSATLVKLCETDLLILTI